MSLGLGWSRMVANWGSQRMSEGFWVGADCARNLWSEAVSDASRAQKTAESAASAKFGALIVVHIRSELPMQCQILQVTA